MMLLKLLRKNLTQYNWKDAAKKIVKAEMLKRNITNQALADALVVMGLNESAATVQNKIYRSSFSATFFLQCMKAMRVDQITLSDDFF